MTLIAFRKPGAALVGILIRPHQLEGVLIAPGTGQVLAYHQVTLPNQLEQPPEGTTQVPDSAVLSTAVSEIIKTLKAERKPVYLSINANLARVMEVPKLERDQLHLALSSEAERFRGFDGTEAIIDFHPLGDTGNNRKQRVLAIGVRKDTLEQVLKACQLAKAPVKSVSVDVVESLRGFAGCGLLDSFRQQAGSHVCWGGIFASTGRVRLMVFQGVDIHEVRELQLNLSQLQTLEEAPFLLDDLLEEIQRTAKVLGPSVWFGYGLSPSVITGLAGRLQTPVREMCLPAGFLPTHTLDLATLGTGLTPFVQFPFDINLLGFRKPKAATTARFPGAGGKSSGSWPMINKVAAGSAVLFLLAWLSFTGLGWAAGQKKAGLEKNKQTLLAGIAAKQQTLTLLRKQSSIQEALLDAVQRIRTQNTTYQKLARDLRLKTPGGAWLLSLKAGSTLEIEGKALNYLSVMGLARSFDELSYLSDVDIVKVNEAMVGKTPVYEFKLSAGIQPDENLLKEAEATQG